MVPAVPKFIAGSSIKRDFRSQFLSFCFLCQLALYLNTVFVYFRCKFVLIKRLLGCFVLGVWQSALFLQLFP